MSKHYNEAMMFCMTCIVIFRLLRIVSGRWPLSNTSTEWRVPVSSYLKKKWRLWCDWGRGSEAACYNLCTPPSPGWKHLDQSNYRQKMAESLLRLEWAQNLEGTSAAYNAPTLTQCFSRYKNVFWVFCTDLVIVETVVLYSTIPT